MSFVLAARRQNAIEYYRQVERDEKELCESSLLHFTTLAWDFLNPGKPMIRGWYQDAVTEHLEAVKAGQIRRLIINIPPRHAKSTMVTVAFPVWWWLHDPRRRFMCFSYAQALSTKHSSDRRSLIDCRWYQKNWGHRFHLSDTENKVTEFANNERGHMIATSLHGTATGKGGDVLIFDDPHNVKRADSDTMRESDLVQLDRTARTRLDDQKNGAAIVVMQRLHEGDATGHFLAQGGWTHLKVPAISEGKTFVSLPMSKKRVVREPGNILLPEYQPKEVLDELRIALGSYAFAGQFQQEPSDPKGGILKRAWMTRRFKLPPSGQARHDWFRTMKFNHLIISADLPFKGLDANKEVKEVSQVCFQAWGQKDAEFYFLDCMSDWMEFTVSVQAFRDFCLKWKWILEKIIEDKANGPAMISTLKTEISGIIPFTPDTDKISRARSIAPIWQAGNVLMPEDEEWVPLFIDQCASFPKGKLKDKVDTMAQALLRFRMSSVGNFTASHKPRRGTTIVGSQGIES